MHPTIDVGILGGNDPFTPPKRTLSYGGQSEGETPFKPVTDRTDKNKLSSDEKK